VREGILAVGPLGAVIWADDGPMVPDGRSLRREDYPELYKAIGDNFGARTPHEFSLPDLRTYAGACECPLDEPGVYDVVTGAPV